MKKIIVLTALLALMIGFVFNSPIALANETQTADEETSIDITAFLADEGNLEAILSDYSNIDDEELLQAVLDELNLQLENLTSEMNSLQS